MSEISIVMITAGTEEEAARIGLTLVEERLAACANMVPRIRSIYRWKGKIHDEQEFLIIVKTRTSLFEELENGSGNCTATKSPKSYHFRSPAAFRTTSNG